MNKLIFLLSFLFLLSCTGEGYPAPGGSKGQNISVLIKPYQTDQNYLENEKSHYIVRNKETHLNKLMLFIGGSYSSPKNYNLICDHAATIGLDVISLSYTNDVPAAPLGSSSDPFIFDHYRDEICYGNPVSDEVNVNELNSIITRAIKLLEYLSLNFPKQNWNQYLTTSHTLQWDKIIIAGHSQGSGHACYLGKKNLADRVVMFSGPNDFSTHFNQPANWLGKVGKTPLSNYYSLLHTKDQIISFNYQVENLRKLELLAPNEIPLLVDNLSTPYNNAHSLSLKIPAISKHNSTIGRNKILPQIWTYMLLSK